MSLNKVFPLCDFSGIQNSVGISIKTSNDDTSINGGKSGKGVSEFVVVQRSRLILVDGVPVFSCEVVEEGLGRVRHTGPGSSLGTTLGKFSGGYFIIAISIAESPQWVPVVTWDCVDSAGKLGPVPEAKLNTLTASFHQLSM